MSIYDFEEALISGEKKSISDYRGNVLLIVNTASKCGHTPQYDGLETLYKKLHSRGFQILAFPCNQFGWQESGSNSDIKNFCELNFKITFPLFEKIKVNGKDAHPLFKFLKKEAKGKFGIERITWNFTKFLIDRNGKVVRRFSPETKPAEIEAEIIRLL
ncbi:MAG: glutathione peroxidase [Ignavibacteriaceae bacterium]|nr:glutathione peroxidase [Ignavibacteriaceae bacterium]